MAGIGSAPAGQSATEPVSPAVPLDVLAIVFVGGAAGGLARWGLAAVFPVHPGRFPWATFGTNVVGCLLIGVLMTLLLAHGNPHRLIRPFVGVGILGGFTTFSTFVVEADRLSSFGSTPLALTYIASSIGTCLVAVWLGTAATRRLAHIDHEPIETVGEWS